MQTHAFMRSTLLLLVLAAPTLVQAQFQQPTDEELKMTADPKAPGAAAVYLNREEKTDDNVHYHSIYVRIKVLTEKGRELATVSIPYQPGDYKVAAIQGRTIHHDGTIIPLKAKPSDMLDLKTSTHQYNQMVFTLPSVEVGSILEYYLQLRYSEDVVSSPRWDIQQPYFVHKAHYFFSPGFLSGQLITNNRGQVAEELMYQSRFGPASSQQVTRDTMGRYSLDLTDIPPLPDEEWMPPLNTLNWNVVFYYTTVNSGEQFWNVEGKHWAKFADSFINPSGTLKTAVAQIVSPGDSEEQVARRIYAAVMKLDNTDFTRKKSQTELKAQKVKAVKDATGVWKQQSGSGDEIALLYVALARAAGLKAWPMQVVDRDRAIFESTFLSMSQFDDYIAIVQIDAKDVFLDPGQKMCPFGDLHWKHQLAKGLRLSDNGTTIASTSAAPPKLAVVQRVADLTLDEGSNVKGTVRFVMTGPEALHWRQLSIENDENQVRKLFNESLRDDLPEGVQADFDHFLAYTDYESNLIGIANISGKIGSSTNARLILPGLFFESRAKHPFVGEETRTVQVDLHFAEMEQDEITYRLPPGFEVESMPRSSDIPWADRISLKIGSSTQNGIVNVDRTFVRNFALLDPVEYNNLRYMYTRMAAADQEQLVLTRTSAAKGNE
ncbi:MAG: DUF3857 domain-containing protein [Terracidiphilus sp.]